MHKKGHKIFGPTFSLDYMSCFSFAVFSVITVLALTFSLVLACNSHRLSWRSFSSPEVHMILCSWPHVFSLGFICKHIIYTLQRAEEAYIPFSKLKDGPHLCLLVLEKKECIDHL